MRISDWSSDVCSSVLAPLFADMPVHVVVAGPDDARHRTLLDGAADTLAGHQFSKTLRQGKPEAVIADVVAATPGAILVMGAYGNSALRTLIVGSRTTADRKSTRLNYSH